MIPVTRKEQYLNRLTGEEQVIPEEPITRTEQYLARLCGVETEIPSSPITREEAYLAYLNGEDVTLPEPITRLEQFMAFAAGKSETKPTPLTREEFYWDKYQSWEEKTIDFAPIITVTDALAKPLKACTVKITPVQSGSGDPSPDNIRPISGWTGCNVTRCGKNLCSELESGTWRESASVIGTAYDDMKKPEDTRIRSKNIVPVTTPMVISIGSGYEYALIGFDANGGYLGVTSFLNFRSSPYTASTWPRNATYIAFAVRRSDYAAMTDTDIANCHLQLELGSAATTYKPYTGTTYPITFPTEAGTVYGGTLDVTNGTLTVTHTAETYDGTEDWIALSESRGYYKAIDGSGYSKNEILKSSFLTGSNAGSSASMPLNSIMLNSSKTNLLCRVDTTSDFPTLDSWKAFLTQNNLTVVYPLAEPLTYHLTPTEVQMLLGTNNIWADTGDISITYLAKGGGKAQEINRSMALNVQKLSAPITEDVNEEEVETEETEQEDEDVVQR